MVHTLPVEEEFVMQGRHEPEGRSCFDEESVAPGTVQCFLIVNDMVHIGATSCFAAEGGEGTARGGVFRIRPPVHAPLLRFCHYAVAQPLAKIGQSVADILIRRMEGDHSDYPSKVMLTPSIHVMKENGGIASALLGADDPATDSLASGIC